MTSSKIRWFGQLCDAKKISYHFKNPLPAASFWKKNNPDPCLKMFWTRFIAIRSASPTQTMIINQTIELSEDECFWHRKSHRICDSFMFINFAFSKKMFCWRKKNDISIALFYRWVKTTYYNFSKVLGKVQTDLCFEKPKFHIKIWKQNLGQNLKERNIKLSYIIV